MGDKIIVPAILFIILASVLIAGCTGAKSAGWSFTINGDPAKSVNDTVYAEFKNASTYVTAADGSEVDGISLELFLYHYGLYPVDNISFGGTAYDWKSVVESVDVEPHMLVEPNGSIFFDNHSYAVDNIDVATAEKPSVSTLDIEPSVLYAFGAGGRDDLIHEKTDRMVIFYVDAMGYDRYEDALSQGMAKNMSSLGQPIKAIAVYPTITQVNSKAMMTGKDTDLARGNFRSVLPYNDTIFDILERQGLQCVWVDGFTAPIAVNRTVLNIDKNGDGSDDDEAAAAAIQEYKGGADLIVAHFVDPDQSMEIYDPYSKEGLESVGKTDALIGKVLQSMDKGTLVVVWADHGCHTLPDGGYHGSLAEEDMYVPIIIGRT